MVYNFENIHEISNDDLHFTINSQLFVETLLMEIRGKTISYSSYKRKERDKIERDLLKEIDTLECNVNQASIQLLENKKQDLENIRKEKIKGKIIRSRVQWIEEGEKPTKYFCGLESKKFTSKKILKIERDDGKTITKQFDILKETKVFYEELYKFREGNGCKVSDLERDLKDLKL